MNRFRFWWRYLRGHTPWDTQIVPPEIVALAQQLPPGRALDIGCGTGTNAIYLAECGWQTVGVDFVSVAIKRAQRKAEERNLRQPPAFYVADASRLDFLTPSFDFVFDIGCLHGLSSEQRGGYAMHVARLTHPGAVYALYGFMPREVNATRIGIDQEDVQGILGFAFALKNVTVGQDRGSGPASAWYYLERRAT